MSILETMDPNGAPKPTLLRNYPSPCFPRESYVIAFIKLKFCWELRGVMDSDQANCNDGDG